MPALSKGISSVREKTVRLRIFRDKGGIPPCGASPDMAVRGRIRHHIRLDPPVPPLKAPMRRAHAPRRRPGALDITGIGPNVRSRDDIPAVLTGLQDPRGGEAARKRLSGLPDRMALPRKGRRATGPGMELLTVPVPGVPLPSPGLPAEVGRTVIERGHAVAGRSIRAESSGKAASGWPRHSPSTHARRTWRPR